MLSAKLVLHNNLEMKKDSTPTRQNGEEINRVNDSSLGAKNPSRILSSGMKIEWSEDDSRMTQMGGDSLILLSF